MDWKDLFAAIALMLIFEGLLPFAYPESARRNFLTLAQLPNKQLRAVGVVALVAGITLLYWARW